MDNKELLEAMYIYQRKHDGTLVEISILFVNVSAALKEAAQQGVQRTVDQPCEKHNMEFCSECSPVVVVDFNRR